MGQYSKNYLTIFPKHDRNRKDITNGTITMDQPPNKLGIQIPEAV